MNDFNEFKKALAFTLQWEGGYVNDPKDPGGETKWGISKRAHPELDIANLSKEDAAQIYATEYWDACGCDDIPFPLNAVVFDTAVNCGVKRASDWLRRSTDVDGYLALRKQHYIDIINKNTNLMKFSKGWWNRLADLKKFVDISTAAS